MGKGGLNRLLLSSNDSVGTDPHATGYNISATDPRSAHIRTLLAHAPTFTLRVAVQPSTLHDSAIATVLSDGAVQVLVPHNTSRSAPPPPPVALVVAMQRPKVIGRVLEAAAAVGVSIICVVAAEKVEKSYWDCKLFRDDSINTSSILNEDATNNIGNNQKDLNTNDQQNGGTFLPGRPRGHRNHPHRDQTERKVVTFVSQRRVDQVPSVRRRLLDAVQQASADAAPPIVLLERKGLKAMLSDPTHLIWQHVSPGATRVVAHPYRVGDVPPGAISQIVARGSSGEAVLAIGPEGGWVQEELNLFASSSFSFASLGDRVLRSETATVVSLGLVHEGLRLRENEQGLKAEMSE